MSSTDKILIIKVLITWKIKELTAAVIRKGWNENKDDPGREMTAIYIKKAIPPLLINQFNILKEISGLNYTLTDVMSTIIFVRSVRFSHQVLWEYGRESENYLL